MRAGATTAVAALLAAAVPASAALPVSAAEARSPLAALSGFWSGQGTINTLTGVEHATCSATYAVEGRAARLGLNCTSEHFRLALASAVVEQGGAVSGTWSDRVFGTSGTVSGRASGGRLGLVATVVGANVTLAIATEGARQTVSLRTTSPLVTDGTLLLARQR